MRALELAHETLGKHYGLGNYAANRKDKSLKDMSQEELHSLLSDYGLLIARLKWAMLDDSERQSPGSTGKPSSF